jgi:hypothetical protein
MVRNKKSTFLKILRKIIDFFPFQKLRTGMPKKLYNSAILPNCGCGKNCRNGRYSSWRVNLGNN